MTLLSVAFCIAAAQQPDAIESMLANAAYKRALEQSQLALEALNPTDGSPELNNKRAVLYQQVGRAQSALGHIQEAERAFEQSLLANPDAALDPFVVPPADIQRFESARLRLATQLAERRQTLAYEQAQRNTRLKLEGEQLDSLRQRVIELERIRAQSIPSQWAVLLPFGLPQFQQRRRTAGYLFLGAQAASAATSIASYLIVNRFQKTRIYTFDDRLGAPNGRLEVVVRGVPEEDLAQARGWNRTKWISGALFYALWIASTVDAATSYKVTP